MSDEDIIELDDLVGEWADAASKAEASDDVSDLDALAEEWASTAAASADTPPPDVEAAQIEDDWAARAPETVNYPPPPSEPITLPKRPAPVTLPPLPEGDFADAALQGDNRYATPAQPEPSAPETASPVLAPNKEGATNRPPMIPAPETATPAPARQTHIPTPLVDAPPPASKPTLERVAVDDVPPHIHAYEDEGPIWRRWLPFGILAAIGIIWLAIMALMGQNTVRDTDTPRVIEQPTRSNVTAAPAESAPTPAAPQAEIKPETPAAAKQKPQPKPNPSDASPPQPAPTPPKPKVDPVAVKPEPERVPAKPAPVEPTAEKPEPKTDTPPLAPAIAPVAGDPKPTAPTPPKPVPVTEQPKPIAKKPEPVTDKPAAPAEKPAPVVAKVAAPKPNPGPAAPLATPGVPPTLKPSGINTKIAATRPKTTTRRVSGATSTDTLNSLAEPSTARPAATTYVRRSTTTQTSTAPASPTRRYSTSYQSPAQPLTAAELLHEDAAKGARTLSTPDSTARFNAAINRALDTGKDGQAQALTTPDGRLLAIKILSTQEDQARSMLIPRGREVSRLPSNLTLDGDWYRTTRRVGLRATPYEGPATHSLERGELLESIGTIGDGEWKLVGQNARALGYLKASELQLASRNTTSRRVIDDPKAIAFDVARVRTRCRQAQYAIDDGGASGSFTACRVHGGEWVIERSGNTSPLSPGRLVFKR